MILYHSSKNKTILYPNTYEVLINIMINNQNICF